MGIAAVQKSTGTLIEWQSHATPGTCLQNALNAGFARGDVEEREISYNGARALFPPVVLPKKLSIDDLADLLVEKKVLSAQDVEGKKK